MADSFIPREVDLAQCTAVACDRKYMAKLGVKIDEETGRAVPDESNLVDLDALIQTYRGQCGMELAKHLIKLGQAAQEDFADDGNHGFDATIVPESAQERSNAAIAAKANLDAIKQAYGIPLDVELTQDQYDSLVKAFVEKHLEQFVKPTAEAVKTEGGNE